MTTHFEDIIRQNSQRLDDLKKTTEELQRELSEARVSLERELARPPHGHAALTDQIPVYPGPAREAFSAPSPVPAQGHYTEEPLPYYAEDSRPYYAPDEPPFVGEGPGAGRGGAHAPADAFRGAGQTASDRTAFDGYASGGAAFEGPAPNPTAFVGTTSDRTAFDGYASGGAAFEGAASNPAAFVGTASDHTAFDGSSPDYRAHGYGASGYAASDYAASDYRAADYSASDPTGSDPTVGIVSHGRQSAYRRRLSRRSIIAIAGAAAVLVAVLAVIITSGGASWPASVATVQAEVVKACQNPDVVSEPGQVNFACAKATRQILWVFALLTSNDNPQFADTKTGRQGLEPITPSQGGAVAASLNLHHPYDPANPLDSIAVAARAINDIIGGATLTGINGNPVVQPGLESHSGNCLRYTGSGLVTSRQGFPDLCARRVSGTRGQMELVSDIYRKWIVGASAGAAHDAAVLFANADNPGNPQVQAILRQLGNETLAA
ncbi:MAG TPA: hypothetical protein VF933_34140 [Streptosporangiaceae bacterium]